MDEPTTIRRRSVAFIDNLLDVRVATPVGITPGQTLRRPSLAEVRKIRSLLDETPIFYPPALRREYEGCMGDSSEDPDQSNYWVIEFEDEVMNLGRWWLHIASRLTQVEFSLPFTFAVDAVSGGVRNYRAAAVDLLHTRPERLDPQKIDENSIEELRRVLTLVTDPKAPREVMQPIETFAALKAVPRSQQLYLMGLFAVLESLLTHEPQPGGPSLTHQLRQKLMLLSDRFPTGLDYSVFHSKPAPEKVWTKLYALRSQIAHGATPDFKALHLLRDFDTARNFVEAATKAVLKQALKEPRLVINLKKC